MKKTYIISALLVGMAATVSAADLVYGLDFNTAGDGGVQYTNKSELTGLTAITAYTGYHNYLGTSPTGEGGYATSQNQAQFNIEDTDGLKGLDFATGFSLGIHVQDNGTANWKDAISMTVSGKTLRLQHTSDSWTLYLLDDASTADASGTLKIASAPDNEWTHIGLVFEGNTVTAYANGVAVEGSLTLPDSPVITQIRGAGAGRAPGKGAILVDNLAVYNDVLTAENFAALSTAPMPTSFTSAVAPPIPEPATATLSLLALAGLAARRRRK